MKLFLPNKCGFNQHNGESMSRNWDFARQQNGIVAGDLIGDFAFIFWNGSLLGLVVDQSA